MLSHAPGAPMDSTGPTRKFTLGLVMAAVLAAGLMAGCATPSSSSSSALSTADEDSEADDAPVAQGGTLGPATGITGTAWAELCAPARGSAVGGFASKDLAWEVFRVPGKQPTQYSTVQHAGQDAVQAIADASGSILRHHRRIEPQALGNVRFSWNVPKPGAEANQSLARIDDRPVRVVLAFDGDRSKFSMKNAMLSELSLMLTGEKMPFATLVYTWSRVAQAGEVIANERTDRIRKLVIDSGEGRYDQWLSYERDIRADYRKVFGEEPGALLSMAVFTEGERNDGPVQAFYGPLQLVPGAVMAAASPP